jgi:hypothetical protein
MALEIEVAEEVGVSADWGQLGMIGESRPFFGIGDQLDPIHHFAIVLE